MTQTATTSNELLFWISKAVDKENFSEYEISLDGTSDKCDGYVGDIVFVNVTGKDCGNKSKTLSLVIKHSKPNEHLRASSFKLMFDAEIRFYDEVYPLFERFQSQKNVSDPFTAIPRCFTTLRSDKKEVIVLENLKTLGYEMYDRKKPLNIFHIKAVLEQLGKFHALSFAIRDQQKEAFESVLKDYPNFFGSFLTSKFSKGSIRIALNNAMNVLLMNNEVELAKKLNGVISEYVDDVSDVLAKMVDQNGAQSVIVHGDAWCNNFMFKYKGNNRTSPMDVAMLDFQFSYPRSPAVDLSFVFCSTVCAEELKHFDTLMRIYYESFSSFLRALGSDPEELFPFSALKSHWRRFSMFGVLYSPFLLPFVLCDKENAPDFQDLQDQESLEKLLIIDVAENKLFFERYRDVVRHYFDYIT